jgi:integrase
LGRQSSNPLRRRHLVCLAWRADNTGELYQRVDKSWWIRISKAEFKNRLGAAGENNYDCMVQPSAWPNIGRYLFIYRPKLLREPTDLVFLTRGSPGKKSHRPWTTLSMRVHELTAKYLSKCVGVGSHAFRHLVATSILKAEGGDYKTPRWFSTTGCRP